MASAVSRMDHGPGAAGDRLPVIRLACEFERPLDHQQFVEVLLCLADAFADCGDRATGRLHRGTPFAAGERQEDGSGVSGAAHARRAYTPIRTFWYLNRG